MKANLLSFIYNGLPNVKAIRSEFKNKVIAECGIESSTFYYYINSGSIPKLVTEKIIHICNRDYPNIKLIMYNGLKPKNEKISSVKKSFLELYNIQLRRDLIFEKIKTEHNVSELFIFDALKDLPEFKELMINEING